ncbi:MAG: metallophosphoesterase [Leptolyngbyaceae bacterium]|nr:metallophosphoesterase [Leptolyngbyaceae bacterium]
MTASSAVAPTLLTDPFLQLPTNDSVRVVWFTEFEGRRHVVEYGDRLQQSSVATTRKLSRTREDSKSRVGEQVEEGQIYSKPVSRSIWRHEAEVSGLPQNQRVPYRIVSTDNSGQAVSSEEFDLAPLPSPGAPLKILLTSDHQLMPMTPANLQKVKETVGNVDAIFLAGDLINIPDRASEWFDDNRGRAFFPALQGKASSPAKESDSEEDTTDLMVYQGGALIQFAPLFPAVGNHEVMGRFSMEKSIGDQFGDPVPRAIAQKRYQEKAVDINPDQDQDTEDIWIENNSFNTDTYDEIFTLPKNSIGHSRYYAVTFGDVRLVSLFATNIWRRPSLNADSRGRYRERDEDLENPENWGFGQHIFEAIAPGSPQYEWLKAELSSPEFTQAPYKIVMFHHPPHSLGDNIVPAYTDPIQFIDTFPDGTIKAVRYEYPKSADYLIRDVMPLVEQAGTNLVLYGHSHLWNRFTSESGTHYLETSNVGNTYGAYWKKDRRPIPIGFQEEYVALGDPNGLEPIVPTIDPILDDEGNAQPFIASDTITVFSILDTGSGTVSSYRFDTESPDSPVIKFDEFSLR